VGGEKGESPFPSVSVPASALVTAQSAGRSRVRARMALLHRGAALALAIALKRTAEGAEDAESGHRTRSEIPSAASAISAVRLGGIPQPPD